MKEVIDEENPNYQNDLFIGTLITGYIDNPFPVQGKHLWHYACMWYFEIVWVGIPG